MKCAYPIFTLFILFFLASCEKSIVEEEGKGGSNPAAGVPAEDRQGALTIKEAQKVANGTTICVKGFIVAATQQSIGNADFASPFEGTSAIVLASRQSNTTDSQFTKDELFPICLTDASKGIREAYNLANNPQYWNCFAYISGTKDTYMSLDGLKKIKGIEIDLQHIVTKDEEPDSIEENTEDNTGDETDGNGDEDDNDENNNNDEDSGNDNDQQQSDNVLTVAQAIAEPEQASLTVQGYIVAAMSGGKDYISFDYPEFNGYRTAIVLADQPYESEGQFDTSNFTDLFIIYLADCKPSKIIGEINLVSHPDYQNKLVQITGRKGFYYGTKLLLEVSKYNIIGN
ncbi:MAG: hypothetical protein J1E37_04085 [Prevotella sp.]|nr:hypothetical protein [Prevotella sp.]